MRVCFRCLGSCRAQSGCERDTHGRGRDSGSDRCLCHTLTMPHWLLLSLALITLAMVTQCNTLLPPSHLTQHHQQLQGAQRRRDGVHDEVRVDHYYGRGTPGCAPVPQHQHLEHMFLLRDRVQQIRVLLQMLRWGVWVVIGAKIMMWIMCVCSVCSVCVCVCV